MMLNGIITAPSARRGSDAGEGQELQLPRQPGRRADDLDGARLPRRRSSSCASTRSRRSQAALEKRQHLIEESIDSAKRTKAEADEILAEYRERLKEARVQAEEIVARARKNGEAAERAGRSKQAKGLREEQLEQARKDIQAETARALQEIRKEVADLTVAATERVTRKTLNEDDQRRLVEEALSELDFTALGERR